MCDFSSEIDLNNISNTQKLKLEKLKTDALITQDDNHIAVTENGKHFIRNICMAIDDFLDEPQRNSVFSQTI